MLVKTLIDKQPSEVLRCPLSQLLCVTVKTTSRHNRHTSALVITLIDAYKMLDLKLESGTYMHASTHHCVIQRIS